MKNRVPNHIKTQLVADAVARDPSGRKGPRTIKQEITYDTGIPLTRCVIAALLLHLASRSVAIKRLCR